jgi:hypothetical protein
MWRSLASLVLALLVTMALAATAAFGVLWFTRLTSLPRVPPWLPLPMLLALAGLTFYRLWRTRKAMLLTSVVAGGLTVGAAFALHRLLQSL